MANPRLRLATAAFAVLAAALAAPVAEAVTVTWNTCAANGNGRCAGGLEASARAATGTGSETVFRFAGLDDTARLLEARAFASADDLGLGAVGGAAIDIFGGGLGAHATGERNGSPNHALDDIGLDELIVFEFGSDDYIPLSFRIGWRGADADIATFIGGTLGGIGDALGAFLGGGFAWDGGRSLVDAFGFTPQSFDDVLVGDDNLFNQNASGRFLIIAAQSAVRYETRTERLSVTGITRDDCAGETFFGGYDFVYSASRERCTYKLDTVVARDAGMDAFKVSQIVGALPEGRAPEPGSIVLLGLGLAAAIGVRRRAVL